MSKRILVVGASKGIGRAITQKLIDEGNEVIAFSRSGDHPEGVSASYEVDVLKGDLPDIDGKLDGLVYLPGTINLKPFRQLSPEEFSEDIEINYLGAVRVLQQYQKQLREDGVPSSVVMISTVAVGQGMPFHASVAGAKAAVEGLGRSLAAEWAPSVRVNVVSASLTDTPLAKKLLSSDDKRERLAERHPLKRVGQPSDIASAAVYLLSDDSSWMSGQVIGVDGGMSRIRV